MKQIFALHVQTRRNNYENPTKVTSDIGKNVYGRVTRLMLTLCALVPDPVIRHHFSPGLVRGQVLPCALFTSFVRVKLPKLDTNQPSEIALTWPLCPELLDRFFPLLHSNLLPSIQPKTVILEFASFVWVSGSAGRTAETNLRWNITAFGCSFQRKKLLKSHLIYSSYVIHKKSSFYRWFGIYRHPQMHYRLARNPIVKTVLSILMALSISYGLKRKRQLDTALTLYLI